MKTSLKNTFGAVALLLVIGVAGTAFAQSAPTVGIATSGPTNVMVVNDASAGTVVGNSRHVSVPATAVTMATVVFTSMQNRSVQLSALPLSITPGNGASASYLSSCQIVNAGGTALNTGSNIPTSIQSGTNTFVLDTPLVVGAGATVSVNLRCNISGSATPGNTFDTAVIPSATVISLSPTLSVTGTAIPAIQTNTSQVGNVNFGTVRLDATQSGSDIRVSAVPFLASTSGGASAGSATGCQLFAPNGVALNTGANVGGTVGLGSNVITLDTPFIVPSNTFTTLTLRCSVNPGVTTGGIITLAPGAGTAFNVSAVGNGGPVILTVANVTDPAVPVGGVAITPTPGVPGTGEGTSAGLWFSLAVASLVILGGTLYVRKTS